MKAKIHIIVLFLTCLVLLCGCSTDARIIIQAEVYAERWAEQYILEKYGIKAEALGHKVQSYGALIYSNTSVVLVPMSYGEEVFCVYLDLENKTARYDNRQSAEVSAVLETYFRSLYSLPEAERYEVSYCRWEKRSTNLSVFIDGHNSQYSAENMLDFLYEGQSAEELLVSMERVLYTIHITDIDSSLEPLAFSPSDWPDGEGFEVEAKLYCYRDKASYALYGGVETNRREAGSWDWITLKQETLLTLTYPPAQGGLPMLKQRYYEYRSTEQYGLFFVGVMPFDPAECISVSVEQPIWKVEEQVRRNEEGRAIWETFICEYEQVSPLLTVTPAKEMLELSESVQLRRIICCLPQSYFDANGDMLYKGEFLPDEQTVKVSPLISSQIEMVGNFSKDRGSQSSQYAILRLVNSYPIPN